jgi:replicative DNA helicase
VSADDADTVLLSYRPAYYFGPDDAETGRSLMRLAEVNVAKHRNGRTGVSRLRFDQETGRFRDP